MSPMKKRADATCGCPYYAKNPASSVSGNVAVSKFVNHTLACLVARRGDVSIAEYYKK